MSEQLIVQALQQAHGLLKRGDLSGASDILRGLTAKHPERPDVLHLLGMVQRDGGDPGAARQSLAKAASLSGGNAEILNTFANLLADQGEPDEADRQFAAAILANPAYVQARVNRGRLFSRRGMHEEAIAELERACAVAPRSVLARAGLGNALREAGQAERSIAVLREAVAMDPAQVATRTYLGLSLRAAERPADAIREYDRAESGGYDRPQLLDNRAAAWLDLGEVERARRDYDAVVTRFPAYLEGHRARARLFREYGLEGDPFASYENVARAFPHERAIWSSWIASLMAFRSYDRVSEIAGRARAAVGPDPAFAFARAIALSELGSLDDAARDFDSCAAAMDRSTAFLNAHARHLLKAGDPLRAAASAERAIAIDPDNQFAWAYLGTAWRVLEDPREQWLHDYDRHVARIEARPPGGSQDHEEFAREAAATLRALHISRVHPPDQSLRNGTQTAGALFDRRDPFIQRIRQTVVASALGFVAGLPDDPTHPLLRRKAAAVDFSGSWSVRLTQHGFHINHVHERGWISSAYYFALPPHQDGDRVEAGHLQLGAPPAELELGLGPRRVVEPAVGTLILFPSSMWHGTIPFTSAGERLTAAFDIIPA